MKKRKSNEAWNPSEETLKYIDELKELGDSYRSIGRLYGKCNTCIRKYHLRYLSRKKTFWQRLLVWFNK